MTNLVDAGQVMSATGRSVDAAAIAVAQSVVEIETGYDLSTTEAVERWRARDLRMLRQAVAWQTAYMDVNPDVATQLGNLQSANANGVSASWAGTSDSSLLAPLAKKALARLSQRGSRTMYARPHGSAGTYPQTLVNDDGPPDWVPLR